MTFITANHPNCGNLKVIPSTRFSCFLLIITYHNSRGIDYVYFIQLHWSLPSFWRHTGHILSDLPGWWFLQDTPHITKMTHSYKLAIFLNMYEDKTSPYNLPNMLQISLQHLTTTARLSETCNNSVSCIIKRQNTLFWHHIKYSLHSRKSH